MNWIEAIAEAINYIEENLTNEIDIDSIAKKACFSPFYFQKGFAMLCGFTVGDYIRQRRLTLAGSEFASTDIKIIDLALKYGYESPDSFTKAFTRFHGATPTEVRKEGAMIKVFAPLKIKFSLDGGYLMDYKIVEKDEFTVVGYSGMFKHETSKIDIPNFWREYVVTGKHNFIFGTYGVCIENEEDRFEYLIADDYNGKVPEGCVIRTIPKHTWAVFPCFGPMPTAIHEMNRKIYSEWLPNCKEYEIADGYNIEFYTDFHDYPKGNQDEKYYTEIWIPVKRK